MADGLLVHRPVLAPVGDLFADKIENRISSPGFAEHRDSVRPENARHLPAGQIQIDMVEDSVSIDHVERPVPVAQRLARHLLKVDAAAHPIRPGPPRGDDRVAECDVECEDIPSLPGQNRRAHSVSRSVVEHPLSAQIPQQIERIPDPTFVIHVYGVFKAKVLILEPALAGGASFLMKRPLAPEAAAVHAPGFPERACS